jgi:hypothetical protein
MVAGAVAHSTASPLAGRDGGLNGYYSNGIDKEGRVRHGVIPPSWEGSSESAIASVLVCRMELTR